MVTKFQFSSGDYDDPAVVPHHYATLLFNMISRAQTFPSRQLRPSLRQPQAPIFQWPSGAGSATLPPPAVDRTAGSPRQKSDPEIMRRWMREQAARQSISSVATSGPSQIPPTQSALKSFYDGSDLGLALAQGQTPAFLQLLRSQGRLVSLHAANVGGPARDSGAGQGANRSDTCRYREDLQRSHAPASPQDDRHLRREGALGILGSLHHQLQTMEMLINSRDAHGLPASVCRDLKASIDEVRSAVSDLSCDRPLSQRALGAIVVTLAGATPVALGNPIMLNQPKFMASSVAFYTKTLAYTLGIMLNPNSGRRSWNQLWIERHAMTAVQVVMYAVPAFSKNRATQELRDSLVFNLLASVAGSLALSLSYYRAPVRAALKRSKGLLGQKTPFNLSEISLQARKMVTELIGMADAGAQVLPAQKAAFVGKTNDATNAKISEIAEKYEALIQELIAIHKTGLDPQEHSPRVLGCAANPDRIPKLGMAIFTGLMAVAIVALFYPEYAAMSDYVVTEIFASVVMVLMAGNPNIPLDVASAAFQKIVGLTPLLAIFLAIDKFKPYFNPIPEGTDLKNIDAMTQVAQRNLRSAGFIGGTAALTLSSLFLSSYMGSAASAAAVWATQAVRQCKAQAPPQESVDEAG
jgi:hypothetical protein